MSIDCCKNIAGYETTCLFPGVIRYNCGECGAYIHHLVNGQFKHLRKDPKPPEAEQPKEKASPKKTTEQKAAEKRRAQAEKMREEQAELTKRLEQIRRVLQETGESDSQKL